MRKMDSRLLAAIMAIMALLPLFISEGQAVGNLPTRVGRSDFTIRSMDVDPEFLEPGLLDYPDTYSADKYENEQITMDVSDEVPEEGDTVMINLSVFNLGLESGSADVEFYDGPKDQDKLIGTDRVYVESFSYDIATTSWDTEGIEGEDHEIFAYLIPDDPDNETNTDNNDGSKAILINFYPVAVIEGFSIVDGQGSNAREGDVISFDGSSSGDTDRDVNAGLDYEWYFDDENSNMSNPVKVSDVNFTTPRHTFGDSGRYEISLKVTDQHGASANSSLVIDVSSRSPEPVISSSLDILYEDQEVKFDPFLTMDSDHDLKLMQYRWNFGDGNGTDWTEGKELEHVYQESGPYVITLEAMDDEGLTGSTELDIEVFNVQPTAVIDDIRINGESVLPSNNMIEVVEDDLIYLSGSSSYDSASDVEGLEYRWMMDGHLISNNRETRVAIHESGSEEISLAVKDDDGDLSLETLEIRVSNMVPVADAGDDMRCTTNIIEFNASASTDTPSDRSNLTYRWDMGDGSFDYGMVVQHEYEEKGTFLVELTVIDDDGEESKDRIRITIENLVPEPIVDHPNSVYEDEIFYLDSTGSVDNDGEVISCLWRFGDGSVREGFRIPYVFHESGTERISVSVEDDSGARSRIEIYINVINLEPVADAGPNNETVIGRGVLLDGRGSNDTVSDRRNLTYVWEFENGTELKGSVVEVFLEKIGTIEITLEVKDPEGLVSMDRIFIWVWGSILDSIDIALNVNPAECEPGEMVVISGTVTFNFLENVERFQNIYLPTVHVEIDDRGHRVRVSEDGSFILKVSSPQDEGKYTIQCSVTRLGVIGEGEVSLEVKKAEGEDSIVSAITSPAGIITGLGIIAIGGGSIALFGTDLGRWRFFLLFIPLYSRIRRDKVLDNFERGRIYQYIVMNPGDYYSNIKRMLDINNGTLTYHLKVLEQKEFIRSRTEGNTKRFYPFGMKLQQGPHRDIQDLILELLYIHPGMSQKEIANELGVHVSTVNYHVNMMVGAGILGIHREDRVQRYVISYSATELSMEGEPS